MCGIVGYIGNKKASEILLKGLSYLEYRGYDSSGVALMTKNKIEIFKAPGKLNNLREVLNNQLIFKFFVIFYNSVVNNDKTAAVTSVRVSV